MPACLPASNRVLVSERADWLNPVLLDTKLDGIRLQAHKDGDSVRLFTRSLDDITERLPQVAAS